MPDAVDKPDGGDAVPELRPADVTDGPELKLPNGVGFRDNGPGLPGGEGEGEVGQLVDPDEQGYKPLGDGVDDSDLFGQAEAGEAEPPSREQVVGWARDVLVEELDSAVDDGDTSEALAADAREAVREYATAEAVKFLKSVDRTAVFRNAAEVTDADVEVVVKALRNAVRKIGVEGVLAVVTQLAGDRETLETLLLMANSSSLPTRVKDLGSRFSRGLLFTGGALMCAAGVNIAFLGNASAETALTNETAIGALIAALAALIKHSR
jgi:hypothetical protein